MFDCKEKVFEGISRNGRKEYQGHKQNFQKIQVALRKLKLNYSLYPLCPLREKGIKKGELNSPLKFYYPNCTRLNSVTLTSPSMLFR
jgi:hypothetical protein